MGKSKKKRRRKKVSDDKPTNNKSAILGPDGVPADQIQKKYRMADLMMDTNGTPSQIIQKSPVVAVFIACAIELDKRDQEIAALRAKLDRVETMAVETADALDRLGEVAMVDERLMEGAMGALSGVEADPEEAERDYQDRLRKMHAYFAAHPSAEGPALAGARINRPLQLRPEESGAQPSLVDMRRLEQWLNRHGGAEWSA